MSSGFFEMQPNGVKYQVVNEQHEILTDGDSDRSQRRRIDWQCPAIMYGSLLAGLALAIGHYAFYSHLNNMLVGPTISQTWVNRIGTAFAFLVKLCFVIAASTAYAQRQWLVMGKSTLKIGQIDSMTGILNNIFNLFDGLLWLRHPLLGSIAVVTWLLPIAAVVSPGAITVNSKEHSDYPNVQVPQLSFSNYSNYAETAMQGSWTYQRPQALISRIAYASATTGRILTHDSSFENNTYTLTFNAPALRCGKANDSLSVMVANNTYTYEKPVGSAFDMIAWVGGDDHGIASSNYSQWDTEETYYSLDLVSLDAARLFVATLDFKPNGTGVPHTTTYECQCWNASYTVQFDSSSRLQSNEIVSMKYLNGVPRAGLDGVSIFMEPEIITYNAIMDAFDRLLVGYVFHDRHGWLIDTPYTSSSLLTSIDWYNNNTITSSLESMFHNLTLSMLSADTLLKNSTQADEIAVKVTTYPLIYVFKPRDLVVAYGISLLITIFCTLLGTHAIVVNRACYRNKFSTFVRVTRDPRLSMVVSPWDTGADPLPKRVAENKLAMKISTRQS